MSVYEGKCAVTGCNQQSVLEAAHIIGFRKRGRYEAANGLLLRADWHTLFDLGLRAINPRGFRVELSDRITDKEYTRFHGRRIKIPMDTRYAPSPAALRARYERFKKISKS
ncbi:HNH endonuclease [Bradyrhizobium erythrophlei]|nr:HNH endonuclease signature motif containing protein [Bradyrhizobium erythrophlei]